jgi:general secretion pathway protein H
MTDKVLQIYRNGFTLIELILVLFVIGLGSAIVVSILYRSMDDIYLRTAAKEIATSLRYARNHAVAEKKIYSFVLSKGGYRVYAEILNNSESSKEKMSSIFHKTLPDGIVAEYKDGEDIRIDFYPRGDSTGGEIKLKSEKGSIIVITIEGVSGRVKIGKENSA